MTKCKFLGELSL